MLQIALDCIARGWLVFPCRPRTKEPAIRGGFKSASNDPSQIQAWWKRWPEANVGIATGASGLCVLDIDTGTEDRDGLLAFMAAKQLSMSYTVRTGRRPGYGVQIYYQGESLKSIAWQDGPFGGDIRSATGYVMAPGSVHPSGERYVAITGSPDLLAPVPQYVKTIPPAIKIGLPGMGNAAVEDDGGEITQARNNHMVHLLGKARAAGYDDDQLRAYALEVNETRMVPPLGESELDRIISNVCKYAVPDNGPEVIIGGKVAGAPVPEAAPAEPVDWRSRYLTFEKVRDAKPTEFLINGFMAVGSITALAAPVAQRKSLIALNVAHALCTGEDLFGYFKVVQKPERVVYLCPEMGLASFSTRLKKIGLDSYVGTTLFCQTMDEESLSLAELDEELPGAVVIIDTLTRFVEGDQNSTEAMSKFAAVVFSLKRRGATIFLLHHSVKGASASLTLDTAMRGSTELAAFVTCCWATKLRDPDRPYKSASLLVNVKQRDFESEPFEAVADETCRMHIVGEPGGVAEIKSRADAKAEAALTLILQETPDMGINRIQKALRAAGHKKGVEWVVKAKGKLTGNGVTLGA